MRATDDRLTEVYIVVVARELGKALKGLHDAGIIHRDVKAANVLIHEEGQLQLCDFGVATALETKGDKRKTFIGTLHWMPPELWDHDPEYSDEVDVWAFGCTIYECATGRPPNSDLREARQLRTRMRQTNKAIELPASQQFSDNLRSLVSYALIPDARNRPHMRDVLEHKFLADTETTHPTSSLKDLVNTYYAWLYNGGQRTSLFMKGGAVTSESPGSLPSDDDWNFSTTDGFEKRISGLLNLPNIREVPETQEIEGEVTPKAVKDAAITGQLEGMTPAQKANFEERVRRGADLSNLFDPSKPKYEYKAKSDFVPVQDRRVSDLPLRAMAEDRPSSIASNVIDLGDFDSSNYATIAPTKEETIRLADAATIRAKRGDSKVYRDGSSTESIPKVTLSADGDDDTEVSFNRPVTQDYSFPPKEWKQDKGQGRGPQQEVTESSSRRPAARGTMDWSFQSAMSDAELETPQEATGGNDKSKKHDTMHWSFSDAMAEVSTTSQPILTRPPHLLRTTTQPITTFEIGAIGSSGAELSRPSTANSEASAVSIASTDADPFALEHDRDATTDVGYPVPAALDALNISRLYRTPAGGLSPAHTVPYDSTVAGPVPFMMGDPARIGEEGFPGPSSNAPAAVPVSASKKKQRRRKGKATRTGSSQGGASSPESSGFGAGSSSSPGSPLPRTSGGGVSAPEVTAPSQGALDVAASPGTVERELGGLLTGFGGWLKATGQAVAELRRRRGSRRLNEAVGGGEVEEGEGESEWEDEE